MTNGFEIMLSSFTFIREAVLSSHDRVHEPVVNVNFESSFSEM